MQGAARLIDLSRTASRLWRGPPTGIDRVERAWLAALLDRPEELFALVRTGAGFCLLDRVGAAALGGLGAAAPPDADLLSRLTRRGDARAAAADTAVRAHAVARAPAIGLASMLRRRLPGGTGYLNLGHANLTPLVLSAARGVPGGRAAVFVHDMIPLDHPEFSRPDRVAVFRRRMRAVSALADLVLYNSAHTRGRAEAWFARWGRVPPGLVAPLGVDPARPDPAALPPGIARDGPFFLMLGTIEPRKNHAFMLDVWDALAARLPPDRMPRLVVAGSRGWADPALYARLDAAAATGAVVECAGLSDGAVAALLERAEALVFPSLAEGFGLPLAEAMAAGTPVLCTPLPAFKEIAGDYPVYLAATDVYAWVNEFAHRVGAAGTVRGGHMRVARLPGWDAHVNAVLSVV
ncbi:MAG: glycosyltransferase family 4 protein [Gemmobacter sp.]